MEQLQQGAQEVDTGPSRGGAGGGLGASGADGLDGVAFGSPSAVMLWRCRW